MFIQSQFSRLQQCKIMSYFRNDSWKKDVKLKEDLQKYVGQLFKREEILKLCNKTLFSLYLERSFTRSQASPFRYLV